MADAHPILGDHVTGGGRIYTRTVVLWAVGLTINTDALWDHVAVTEGRKPARHPLVRMMTTATKRRGSLAKRMRNQQTFRSVLSLDVEHRGYMPNLKISARNTMQITGAQNLAVVGDILSYLLTEYRGRGFNVASGGTDAPGFVGDIVLANVHFRLDFRLDRNRLRDVINRERGCFIASYEPLVRDVSVSLKHANSGPLPNGGAVYPRWSLANNAWNTVSYGEALRLVPHINIKGGPTGGPRITSLRVFQSGSVIIVSRWPEEMNAVYRQFVEQMARLRGAVVDPEFARQRTLVDCWAPR
jgi:hypothetical protein